MTRRPSRAASFLPGGVANSWTAPHWLHGLGLILAAAALAGCLAVPRTLPPPADRTISYTQDPPPGSRLAIVSRQALAAHSDEVSGFLMLDRNDAALQWRLLLADLATTTLEMQYYVWKGDASAVLLLSRVIGAADRGVRVRILVDDITLMGSDPTIAALSRHPRIEVRLFNPVEGRHSSTFMRAMEFTGRIEQLNHRMHNKLMVADNRLAIVGGRNIGNEYFGLNPQHNFIDFDVLALGEVVPEIAASFDLYWNSESTYPGESLIRNHPEEDLLERLRAALDERLNRHQDLLIAFAPETFRAEDLLADLRQNLFTGSADVIYDEPLVGADMPPVQLIESLRVLTDKARTEILAATPYFVPDRDFHATTPDLVARGVRVAVLTNSLGATNHPVVHSGYKKHRRRVLEAGVALFEFRRDAVPAVSPNTPPVTAEFLGLHAKFIVIDRRTLFVGSLNLDPRSIYINTELGLLIDSPELAEAATILFENLVVPENAWQLRQDEKNRLAWRAGAEVRASEPPSTLKGRFQAWFFGLFSLDDHL
jgi:putative cardiolipin synthase